MPSGAAFVLITPQQSPARSIPIGSQPKAFDRHGMHDIPQRALQDGMSLAAIALAQHSTGATNRATEALGCRA